MRKRDFNLCSGFTMAEAILVMTILGIIATIMITTLKPAEFKEKGLKVLAKKVLSEIDTATTQILVNNTKLGTMDSLIKSDGSTLAWKDNSADVLEFYKKYLTTIRANVPNDSFCVTGDNNYNASAIYLKDGACIGIKSGEISGANTIFPGEENTQSIDCSQGLLLFDTNGEDEPNTIGKDRFLIPISMDGINYDGGSGAPCKIANCASCYDDGDLCDKCKDGYIRAANECVTPPTPNCSYSSFTEPRYCAMCEDGYKLITQNNDPLTGKCVPN